MRKSKTLNIKELLQLYDIIKPYLPETIDNKTTLLTVAGKIIDNMIAKNPDDYVKIVSFLSKIPEEKLIKRSSDKVFKLFIDGLIANKILLVIKFGEMIGL